MCLRGQEAHQKISSKANPQSKFPWDLLLSPGWNLMVSQEPFGQSEQPNLNISTGSQAHVGHEKQAYGGKQKRPMEDVTQSGLLERNTGLTLYQSDEHYTSSPLVHKEKVTGHHHPYASKPRTPQASSLREEIVDDEDENMSPNHSEKNDEPTRENFMVHEEGTQSNSEFTHPQMPISQSMLGKYKIRKQRNQACKAHNVSKCANQKEQQRWLKEKLQENFHGMRSAMHAHCLFLLKVSGKDFSSLPEPPSTEERKIAIQASGQLRYVPKDVLNEPSKQVQSQAFQRYFENELHKLGIKLFIW
ncbi:hypothetical protein O181_007136 [Austropuccinia psidii MF-1]|uniref:Uncharacterized protein n=1 Tax=Austropuccinia psidii MF-1 TaxID=1389203 RepID=A0A9Q3BM79_9BASI|nr:hypothetical protein [Austropuccinia psidii MF-1]